MIMITIVTRYSYESTSVEDLYQLVAEETLQHKRRLDNLAFLLSGSEKVELLYAELPTLYPHHNDETTSRSCSSVRSAARK